MIVLPSPWKKGDRLLASHLEEGGQAIAALASLLAKGQTGSGAWRGRPGIIMEAGPNGEDDFEDWRYWVRFQNIEGHESDGEANYLLGTEFPPVDSEEPEIVPALNIGGGTSDHLIPVSTRVILFSVWPVTTSDDSPCEPVWIFAATPPSPFVVILSQVGGSANPVSYTYNVYHQGTGRELGTGMTPIYRPLTGNVSTAATFGLADFGGTDNAFRLLQAYETFGKSNCPA